MTPAPSLQELIESVEADASSEDALDQLSHASRTAAGLEEASDALLGHFVDRSRRSGHSWTQISAALGVSKQAAHKRFSLPAATFAFEHFTPRAKAVVHDAAEQARLRARSHVTTGDVLLALFEPAEAVAAQILDEAGVTREACERQLGTAPARKTEGENTDRPPFAEQAKRVLESAAEEALRLRHNYIGTEHLLLGLYHDPEDPAATALADLGLDYANAKDRLARKLAKLTKKRDSR